MNQYKGPERRTFANIRKFADSLMLENKEILIRYCRDLKPEALAAMDRKVANGEDIDLAFTGRQMDAIVGWAGRATHDAAPAARQKLVLGFFELLEKSSEDAAYYLLETHLQADYLDTSIMAAALEEVRRRTDMFRPRIRIRCMDREGIRASLNQKLNPTVVTSVGYSDLQELVKCLLQLAGMLDSIAKDNAGKIDVIVRTDVPIHLIIMIF